MGLSFMNRVIETQKARQAMSLTRRTLGWIESACKDDAALVAVGLIHERGIYAGKILRNRSGLADDFQMVESRYEGFQATGTEKLVPDVTGIVVILEDHVVQIGHRRLSPFGGLIAFAEGTLRAFRWISAGITDFR
jgi:hypothetical protein